MVCGGCQAWGAKPSIVEGVCAVCERNAVEIPLTPEWIEGVFYETYGKGLWVEVDKPLVQSELRKKAWQAVIDAVSKECSCEFGKAVTASLKRDGYYPHID